MGDHSFNRAAWEDENLEISAFFGRGLVKNYFRVVPSAKATSDANNTATRMA